MNSRATLLRSLVKCDCPLSQIKKELPLFEWDSDELVFLELSDVCVVLNKFLGGELTAAEVEEWANLIEGRDDIGFENVSGKTIRDIIYELANPLLCGKLNSDRARDVLRRSGIDASEG